MYRSTSNFERTEAEYADEELSWARSDEAFFAAGACHILAFAFKERHPDASDFEIVHTRPRKPFDRGHHVYVTDGAWAFDFSGWTQEDELIAVSRADYGAKLEGWDFDRVVVTTDLETFCRENNHRPPSGFAHDPWDRAFAYLEKAGAYNRPQVIPDKER